MTNVIDVFKFLVSMNSMLSPIRLSSDWNVRAPYAAGCNFWQCFFVIWYLGHPLTFTENFTEIIPGEPLRRGGGVKMQEG